MQAVILAAGKGLRLRPLTDNTPKPLIPIAGKPLIFYTLEALPDFITEIVIIVGYLGDSIIDKLGKHWQGKPITYINQPDISGTGNALLMAKKVLHDKFLVVNGDDLYSQYDLTKLASSQYGILAWQSEQISEFGLDIYTDNFLKGFNTESSLINCGAYCLNESFFSIPLAEIIVHDKTEYSLPHTLVNLSTQEKVCVTFATFWLPVGTAEQLANANSYYSANF